MVMIMRVVLQVVDYSKVEIMEKVVASIGKGYLLLVGVYDDDTDEKVLKMADKISKLRVFPDENGKTNLCLKDVKGSILSVSQFTLCASVSEGNRPSFVRAGNKEEAIRLYELFNDRLVENGFEVEKGVFGVHMQVSLVNDGPFTLVIEN